MAGVKIYLVAFVLALSSKISFQGKFMATYLNNIPCTMMIRHTNGYTMRNNRMKMKSTLFVNRLRENFNINTSVCNM